MDSTVVERARDGDKEAFGRIAAELGDRLFAVAHRILRDYDAAADALQVGLVRMWRDMRSLRDVQSVEPWAYRIVVRACHDQLRKDVRQRNTLVHFGAGDVAEAPDVTMAQRDELARAFRDLPVEQRAALVLQHYLGMTLPQIAEVLGVPIGTVRSRLHYGRRSMRASLEADERAASQEGTPI